MSVRVRPPAPVISFRNAWQASLFNSLILKQKSEVGQLSERVIMQSSCIFCKIIAKQIPATIIAENDQILVIKDINPKAPIHYLILPKKHVADITGFEEADTLVAGQMLMMAKQLAHELSGSKAFKLMVNNGADAGQIVFHSHIHFLSGRKFADF